MHPRHPYAGNRVYTAFSGSREQQIDFSRVVQRVTDESGKELSAADIYDIFQREYRESEDSEHGVT